MILLVPPLTAVADTDYQFQWGSPGDIPLLCYINRDGYLDVGLFRPSTGQWFFNYGPAFDSVTDGQFQWGSPGDIPFVGYFNDDILKNYVDVAVFRPSTGQWFFNYGPYFDSITDFAITWGIPGDKPLSSYDPGWFDFDANQINDIGLFRPSTGNWFFNFLKQEPQDPFDNESDLFFLWGNPGDEPIFGYFSGGDGYLDVGLFRPSTGQWFINAGPRWNFDHLTDGSFSWAGPGDIPLAGNFDGLILPKNTDVAVFRPNTGEWFFNYGPYFDSITDDYFRWASPGDIPLWDSSFSDFNIDGRDDVAVFRPSTGQWFINLLGD